MREFLLFLWKLNWYRELSDYNKKNTFNVEEYLEHRLTLRENDEFDLIEVEES